MKIKNNPDVKVAKSSDGALLHITIPIDYDLRLSKSGKSHILFTSGPGIFDSNVYVEGEEVIISVTAYIRRLKGR
jgi:hypothetical protein